MSTSYILSVSILLLVATLLTSPLNVRAQDQGSDQVPVPAQPSEGNQCVDSSGLSYQKGVVTADFGRIDIQTGSRGAVRIPVILNNLSSDVYVPNASVIALVYDERALSLETPVVPIDWFVVTDDITVLPQSSEELNVAWNVPSTLVAGSYRIVLHHGQWSMPDVLARGMTDVRGIGSSVVVVTGESERQSLVDPLSVQVSGDGLNPTKVRFTVKNHFTEQPIRGGVVWAVYEGNAPFLARKLEQGTEEIKLTSGTEREYEIEISESALDVRLLTVTINTDVPEKLLIPIYLAPEGVSLSYQQPNITFVGVQGDNYVACVYLGDQGRFTTTDQNEVVMSLANNEQIVASQKHSLETSGVQYARLVHPLKQLKAGYETITLTSGDTLYDQVVSLICESDLCAGHFGVSSTVNNTDVPFNQSYYFYLAVVLAATLLGYVVLRRLPV